MKNSITSKLNVAFIRIVSNYRDMRLVENPELVLEKRLFVRPRAFRRLEDLVSKLLVKVERESERIRILYKSDGYFRYLLEEEDLKPIKYAELLDIVVFRVYGKLLQLDFSYKLLFYKIADREFIVELKRRLDRLYSTYLVLEDNETLEKAVLEVTQHFKKKLQEETNSYVYTEEEIAEIVKPLREKLRQIVAVQKH